MGRPLAIGIVVALVGAWVLGPTLGAPPVYDDAWILGNPRASDPARALASFVDPTGRTAAGTRLPAYAYRPLHELGFALQSGQPPWALHAVQLLLHLACAAAAARIAGQLGGSPGWTAAVVLLHPAGVQAAGYLSQRALVLQTLLALASVTLYLDGRLRWAWLAGLLSMTAKESALALPLTLLGLDLVRDGRVRWSAWLPFALLPLLPLVQILRVLGTGDLSHEPRPGWGAHLTGQGPVLVRYLGLLALPFPLRFAFDRPPTELPALPCWLLHGGLGFWILRGRAAHRLPRAGLALVLLPLATESLLPVHDAAWIYRLYASLAGAGLCFGWALGSRPRLAVAALALLAGAAAGESRLWTSRDALLRRDVRSAPRREAVWGDYAWELLVRRKAQPALRFAGRPPQTHPKGVTARACALVALGRVEEGSALLEAAVERFPDQVPVLELALDLARKTGNSARADALERRLSSLRRP